MNNMKNAMAEIMRNRIDLYEVFGITRDASADEIRNACRKTIRENHPDLHNDVDEETKQKMHDTTATLNVYYDILSDANWKAQYDLWYDRTFSKTKTESQQQGNNQNNNQQTEQTQEQGNSQSNSSQQGQTEQQEQQNHEQESTNQADTNQNDLNQYKSQKLRELLELKPFLPLESYLDYERAIANAEDKDMVDYIMHAAHLQVDAIKKQQDDERKKATAMVVSDEKNKKENKETTRHKVVKKEKKPMNKWIKRALIAGGLVALSIGVTSFVLPAVMQLNSALWWQAGKAGLTNIQGILHSINVGLSGGVELNPFLETIYNNGLWTLNGVALNDGFSASYVLPCLLNAAARVGLTAGLTVAINKNWDRIRNAVSNMATSKEKKAEQAKKGQEAKKKQEQQQQRQQTRPQFNNSYTYDSTWPYEAAYDGPKFESGHGRGGR